MSDGLRERLRRRLGHAEPRRIVAFRGYGTPQVLQIMGRVLEGKPLPEATDDDTLWQNLLAMYTRLESDELIGVVVCGSYAGQTQESVTDRNGYFTLRLTPDLPAAPGWQTVALELPEVGGAAPVRTEGEILIPSVQARFVVISDIDDTILQSYVQNPLRLAQVTLLGNARTRLPFPGAARFYQALHAGVNPIVYLSGSPWNFYDLLSDFMDLHEFPRGPLLLRDLEFGTLRPMLRGASSLAEHKQAEIETLMQTYPDLPFVLIGDSSQKDPEIYAAALRRFPGRVRAIYIRDVSGDRRDVQVLQLAEQLAAQGGVLRYVQDSAEAAEHAAALGLIDTAELEPVRAACQEDAGRADVLADSDAQY